MRRLNGIFTVILGLFVFGCPGCDEEQAGNTVKGIQVTVEKQGDTAVSLNNGDFTDIKISSESGIGEATVRIPRDYKYRTIRFLFQYADGCPFHRLESFRFKGKYTGFQTFLGHGDSLDMEIIGNSNNGEKVPAYIPVRKTADGILITIRAGLIENYPDTVAVSWVDMYR